MVALMCGAKIDVRLVLLRITCFPPGLWHHAVVADVNQGLATCRSGVAAERRQEAVGDEAAAGSGPRACVVVASHVPVSLKYSLFSELLDHALMLLSTPIIICIPVGFKYNNNGSIGH